jgi:succinoglycan biosynthesis protein ExoA
LEYPREKLEIIVARGRQPSVQRNAALQVARGELIYFLDDDSAPLPANLKEARNHFHDPSVKMVGGPNLCPPQAPALEKVFAVVLASWLAFGPSRARYDVVGSLRATSEKELILCNLLARRDALLELGGFDTSLYPNEENALMDELQRRDGKLLYDPHLIVYRRPRPTLKAFYKMLFTYGRGRAEQFRLHPTPGSALNFVPPLFCLYLLALAVLWALRWAGVGGSLAKLGTIPLAAYALAVVGQTAASAFSKGFGRSLLALPLLVASHVFYGLGFWRGLVTALKTSDAKPATEVMLETIIP